MLLNIASNATNDFWMFKSLDEMLLPFIEFYFEFHWFLGQLVVWLAVLVWLFGGP